MSVWIVGQGGDYLYFVHSFFITNKIDFQTYLRRSYWLCLKKWMIKNHITLSSFVKTLSKVQVYPQVETQLVFQKSILMFNKFSNNSFTGADLRGRRSELILKNWSKGITFLTVIFCLIKKIVLVERKMFVQRRRDSLDDTQQSSNYRFKCNFHHVSKHHLNFIHAETSNHSKS